MTRVVVLCGGVGAARFLAGLVRALPPEDVGCIVNTGDDLEVWGVRVCPDVDIVTYTLAGIADRERGWGLRNDSFACLEAMRRLGGPAWFRLGDGDLALSLERTRLLGEGMTLEEVTSRLAARLGVGSDVAPMSNGRVETRVSTIAGELSFEEYFVREGCRPEVLGVRYEGAGDARPSRAARRLLRDADVLVVAPSNPQASIGPVLAVAGMRRLVERFGGPRVAISPIIAGRTVKGPADVMLRAAGFEPSAAGVAACYDGLVDALLVDALDAPLVPALEAGGLAARAAPILMGTPERAEAVAREALSLAASVTRGAPSRSRARARAPRRARRARAPS